MSSSGKRQTLILLNDSGSVDSPLRGGGSGNGAFFLSSSSPAGWQSRAEVQQRWFSRRKYCP